MQEASTEEKDDDRKDVVLGSDFQLCLTTDSHDSCFSCCSQFDHFSISDQSTSVVVNHSIFVAILGIPALQ